MPPEMLANLSVSGDFLSPGCLGIKLAPPYSPNMLHLLSLQFVIQKGLMPQARSLRLALVSLLRFDGSGALVQFLRPMLPLPQQL